MATHFKGPLAGSVGAGPFADANIDLVNQAGNVHIFNDFLQASDYGADWTDDTVGSPTAGTKALATGGLNPNASLVGAAGILVINAGTADATGESTQQTASALSLGDNSVLTFYCRYAITAGSASTFAYLIGIGDTDTAPLGTDGSLAISNFVGFHSDGASSGGVDCVSIDSINASATTDTDAFTADTLNRWEEVAFRISSQDVSAATGLIEFWHRQGSVNPSSAATRANTPKREWTKVGTKHADTVPVFTGLTGVECRPTFCGVNITNDTDLLIDCYGVSIARR